MDRSRRPTRLATWTAIALLVGSTFGSAPSATAGALITFELGFGSTCVGGTKSTGDAIRVELRKPNGALRDVATDADLGGTWEVCFDVLPVAGNRLVAETGDVTRTRRIPALTIEVDRVTDVVRGDAPPDATLSLAIQDCYPSGCDAPIEALVFSNELGRYRADLTAILDIAGGDSFGVLLVTSIGDRFSAGTGVPYVEVTSPNEVHLGCEPAGDHVVRLRAADGRLRAVARFHADQDCWSSTYRFRRNGEPVRVRVGNRIVSDVTSDARFVWPRMSVDGAGTTVSGSCFPNSRIVVFVTRASTGTTVPGTTMGDGSFSVTTGWTFETGDRLELGCETNRGDQARIVSLVS